MSQQKNHDQGDDRLIVALDVPTFEQAQGLIDQLENTVNVFKIGLQQFTAYGPFICRYVQAKGKKVFLDLKFHDIPNTVAKAVESAVSLSVPPQPLEGFAPIMMLTLHTVGGQEMLQAAVEAAKSKAAALGVKSPLLMGVTVLTSENKDANTTDTVLKRAEIALKSGLDGVIASVEELDAIRQRFSEQLLVVTPGIRPAQASLDDQKRVATPRVAIAKGSNFLVVGRPIVMASHPAEAARDILKEMRG